jgi:protein-disulfide isomerase
VASRAEEKAQARAQREAIERADVAAARRGRRLRQLGLVVGAAVVAVAVAIVISSSGGTKKPQASNVSANRATIAAVSQELSGITQSGTRLGSAKAPVKLTYYGDLECPVCQAFTLGALQNLIAKDVRSGKLQIDYKSLETATQDPSVFQDQQTAALAAGQQNRGWNFIELFYNEQGQEGTGYVDEAYLQGLARQTPGLNLAKWKAARGSSQLSNQVGTDADQARIEGANATPTLVITGPKGKAQPIAGNAPYQQIESQINKVA